MIIVGLEWEPGQSGANQTPAWPTNWAWRPECLGQCCVGRPPRAGGDSNSRGPRKRFPMFAPLHSQRPLPQTGSPWTPNQPVLSFVLESIPPRDTSSWHRCTVLFDLSGVFICFFLAWPLLSPQTVPTAHRPALGHTYTGRPHLVPTHLLDCPFRPPSAHTVLFKTCKHASY